MPMRAPKARNASLLHGKDTTLFQVTRIDQDIRDMYHEKWGFMLIFWNLAGVPLSYCHCTIYLANRPPSTYHWNPIALGALYVSYLFVYWVWDTCNSQKNRFRQMERGTLTERKAFPQLPWQTLQNPKTIKTKTGDSILIDGWYGYARKIHYTCDLYFVSNANSECVTRQCSQLDRHLHGVSSLASPAPFPGSMLRSSRL